MKRLLLSCLTVMLIAACSSEENTPVNQQPEGTGTGALKTIDEIWYADFNMPVREVHEYSEDGKLLKTSRYLSPSSEQPHFVWHYTYTAAGLLQSYIVLDSGQESRGKNYTYDSQGRMETLTYIVEGTPGTVIEFSYDINTITANATSITGTEWISKIFHLNNEGIIYKETIPDDENSTFEVAYDGFNVITFEDYWGSGSYTYDNDHDPGLMNLNMGIGTQRNNAILRELSIFEAEGLISTKYISSFSYIFSNGDAALNRNMQYTFSAEGLLLTRTIHENGALERQSEYFYYQ